MPNQKKRICPCCSGVGLIKNQTLEELIKEMEADGAYISTLSYNMTHYDESWSKVEESQDEAT